MEMSSILVAGSLNIDEIYSVHHIAVKGETISSASSSILPGGKGLNQACALGRALVKRQGQGQGQETVHVSHFGRLVKDDGGDFLLKALTENNVNTALIQSSLSSTADASQDMRRTGRAIIQVQETDGDNAIVLFPGENHAITQQDAAAIPWSHYSAILLQNEISHVDTFIRMASENGLRVFFNPAPCPKDIRQCVNLSQVHVLVVNESEFECIMESGSTTTTTTTTTNSTKHQLRMLCLMKEFQNLEILVVTLGEEGLLAVYRRGVGPDPKPSLSTSSTSSSYFLSETETSCIFLQLPAMQRIKVADTIGAGDCFIGFFIASLLDSATTTTTGTNTTTLSTITTNPIEMALMRGIVAAGLSCQKHGAVSSFPSTEQVNEAVLLFNIK